MRAFGLLAVVFASWVALAGLWTALKVFALAALAMITLTALFFAWRAFLEWIFR